MPDNPALADVKQKWDKDGLDIVHLLDKSDRDPALGLAFNYASLLLNNSYFLEGMVCRFLCLICYIQGNSKVPVLTRQTSSETASRYPESYGVDTAKRLTEKLQAYSEGIVGGAWLWVSLATTLTLLWCSSLRMGTSQGEIYFATCGGRQC